jgi:ACR3 family arsenite efflux pump ArsB
MMYPILCKVRYETLHRSFREKSLWIQVAFSIVINWIVAPFFMVPFPQPQLKINPNIRAYSLAWRGLFFQTREVLGKA